MSNIAEKIKEYSKAVYAFVATAGTLAGLILAVPGIAAVLPAAWLTVLGVLVAAGVVAGGVAVSPSNRPGPKVINDTVTGVIKSVGLDVSSSVNNVIDEYVKSVAKQFPQPARAQVEEIGGDLIGVVRNNVDVVVRSAIESFKAKKK